MRSEIVEITKKLIGLPTFEGNISLEMTNQIEEILTTKGYKIQKVILNNVPHYLAIIEGDGPHLAFIGHYDVVPAGENWKSDPFIAKEENGIIYGRGANDMKGALATQIVAGSKLAKLGFRVSLFIPGDEETNSESMPELLKLNNTKIDYVIGGEPTGEKTTGDVIKNGRRGAVRGEVTIFGIPGHTAYAHKAENPIHKLLQIGATIVEPMDDGHENMPPTSLQITNISSGHGQLNIIPGELNFKFDVRNSSKTSIKEVEEIIKNRLDKLGCKYEIQITKKRNHFLTNDLFLINIVKKTINEIVGKEPILSCGGGISDCRFIAEYDPNIPIIEIGVPSENIHGANELVTIKNLELLEEIYLALGKNLLNKNYLR